MKFSEEIVFDVLEKRGYTSPSMIRSSNTCRWYVARKGEDLYEVEAYDSESYGCETLSEYLKSLNALPFNNSFIRKPLDTIAERKITCVVRKYYAGEPLYTYFIRPGELPDEEASQKIKGFEKVHKYLAVNNLGNFAPISIMLFMCTDGETFLDGLKCGPWVKKYENLTVISNYLNPEASWDKQIHFFRNSFALKMLIGDPKLEKYEGEKGKALNSFIEGAIANKNNYSENLSELERKYRPRSKGFFLKAALVTAVFILPLLAYLLRIMQAEPSWMGPSYTENQETKENILERDEFAFEPDETEKILVSHEFLQRSLKIREKMLAGNFKAALDDINELSAVNLRKGELEILNEIRVSYPQNRKEDFEKAISRSRTLLTQSKYDEAALLLQDIVDRYQTGKDAEQADSALRKIKELEETEKKEEKEKLAKLAASVAKDKIMIKKLEEQQAKLLKSPVRDLHGLNQSIDLVRIECVTKAAKYLVSCYIKLNSAEKRLYEQLLNFDDDGQKEKRLELLTNEVTGLGGLHIYDIIATGIEYRDAAGGGNFKFSNIPPKTMYKLFKETSKVDVERAAYYLYLYCLKYGLNKEAAEEFKNITSSELKKEADSLRDIKQARSDLFATK